tara:strand:- start:57 stop:185 length:129 start_codon:yes stop_codon:yes gene_type:complete
MPKNKTIIKAINDKFSSCVGYIYGKTDINVIKEDVQIEITAG